MHRYWSVHCSFAGDDGRCRTSTNTWPMFRRMFLLGTRRWRRSNDCPKVYSRREKEIRRWSMAVVRRTWIELGMTIKKRNDDGNDQNEYQQEDRGENDPLTTSWPSFNRSVLEGGSEERERETASIYQSRREVSFTCRYTIERRETLVYASSSSSDDLRCCLFRFEFDSSRAWFNDRRINQRWFNRCTTDVSCQHQQVRLKRLTQSKIRKTPIMKAMPAM